MNQQTSPFKFLDAYLEEDRDVFFGRDQETEDLYEALNGVKHLLIYGPSGAGKTSLVECGLRNQFSDADWHAISIRRRDNINAAIFSEINDSLEEKIKINPATGLPQDLSIGFGEAIEQLFNEQYQPIYLLFDQFEELLLLAEQKEKVDFFSQLNDLIRYRVPCRVILIMREEFIGHLSEFEPFCPTIFKHRYRLEKMGRTNVRQVIHQILEAPEYHDDFQVIESEGLADTILSKLPDKKKEIELTHVQVFLSELWDRANQKKGKDILPILKKDLINKDDDLESVLDAFLKKQLNDLANKYGQKIPLELLAVMISERSTKLQLSQTEIVEDLEKNGIKINKQFPFLLKDLIDRRIIRTLKTGEETRYEISHDLLAYVVGQNLTKEIKLREKANEIYRVYAERKGLFSQEDLDYLRPYEQYKAYPSSLKKQIQKSKLHIKKEDERELKKAQEQARKESELRNQAESNAKRAKQRTLVATFIAFLAFFTATAAFYFFQNAATQTRLAEQRENERVSEEQRRISAEKKNIDQLVDDINTIISLPTSNATDTTEARKMLENVLQNNPTDTTLINLKKKLY